MVSDLLGMVSWHDMIAPCLRSILGRSQITRHALLHTGHGGFSRGARVTAQLPGGVAKLVFRRFKPWRDRGLLIVAMVYHAFSFTCALNRLPRVSCVEAQWVQ